MRTIDRFVFGKKRMNDSLKEKVKFMRTQLLLFQFATLFALGVLLFLLFVAYQSSGYRYFIDSTGRVDVPIDLSELNEEEKEIAQMLIDSTDSLYFNAQKSIVFTKNISKHRGSGSYPLGFNRAKGDIYISYTGDIPQMRDTLCHEFLHTFLYSDEYTHDVVRDLEAKGVCYND